MSGDVELNPGPVNYPSVPKADLEKFLTIFKDDPTYKVPTTKNDIIAALKSENQTVVAIILHSTKGPTDNIPTTSFDLGQTFSPRILTQKLLTFFEHDTRQWFDQVDQLLSGSSEDTRKNSLLRALPTSVIRDTGANVAASFDEIKSRIITHFDDTQDQKLRKLLREQSLGDQKPSTALRRLQQLAPGNDSLVRIRFLEMLPAQGRIVLATFETEHLEKLAQAADKMLDQLPSTSHVNTIETGNINTSGPAGPVEPNMQTQISQLVHAVNAINTRFDNFQNSQIQLSK